MAVIGGIRGIEHIGLTVPDIEEATRFFVSVLGAEPVYDDGPFAAPDDWMAENLSVDPRARLPKLRILKIANGPSLELFEYEVSQQASEPPRNSDIGGHHLAFYVDDIAAAINALRAHGVKVQGEVKANSGGPSAGLNWCYFLAPWGLQLELVSAPQGVKGYREHKTTIWQPAAGGGLSVASGA
jgi:catechol 2,3-dioxygenase-like lactoylglutathione lyase family enzyme